MTLEKARKILKVIGIITLVGAALSLGFGVLAVAGTGFAATNTPEMQTNPEYQEAAGAIIGGGIGLVVVSVINLIEGVITLLSSKQNKFATVTLVMTSLSLVSCLVNGISGMMKPGFDYKNVISFVIAIALDVAVIWAAKTVRDAYIAEKN